MTVLPHHLLHIDASARPGKSGIDPHGSHTRRLSRRFIDRWLQIRPNDYVTYRDVGQEPPSPITGAWISAVFTPPEYRNETASAQLAESDELIEELFRADIVVMGVPMYNFGIPAQLKAWIDNVVRVDATVKFDPDKNENHYSPMLPIGKVLVILSSKGDYGYCSGGKLEQKNLTERSVIVPMNHIGLANTHSIAIESAQFSDDRLTAAIASAEVEVDSLVLKLTGDIAGTGRLLQLPK